jgi:hypothetical protein
MSASKINPDSFPSPDQVPTNPTMLNLAADQVFFRKNGIEFRSAAEIPVWTEMTVDLTAKQGEKLTCNGVIVSCSGNRHTGFQIAMVFTGMSAQHQQQLDNFAFASL